MWHVLWFHALGSAYPKGGQEQMAKHWDIRSQTNICNQMLVSATYNYGSQVYVIFAQCIELCNIDERPTGCWQMAIHEVVEEEIITCI